MVAVDHPQAGLAPAAAPEAGLHPSPRGTGADIPRFSAAAQPAPGDVAGFAQADPARRTLVCGPSGGGKSRWAEHLAALSARPVVYLATGPELPDDPDWQRRLQRHRQRRPLNWSCREVGGELATALADLRAEQLGLIDALGTWVAAWLACPEESWLARCGDLRMAIETCSAPLVIVGEEVGWGVVPATEQGWRFQSRLTAVQLTLASQCQAHWLVVGGRALDLFRLGVAVPQEV